MKGSDIKLKNSDFIQALKPFQTGSNLVNSDLKRQNNRLFPRAS